MRVYKGYILNITKIRKHIVEMCHRTKTASLGSSLSCVEIIVSIYKNVNFYDRVIISKGHASAGLYAVLDEFMYFGEDNNEIGACKNKMTGNILETYCQEGSKLSVHIQRLPGLVDWSVGSLGHGLPVACGMAKGGSRVFVLMSDGELCEGSNWEAIKFAGENKLEIISIIDYNQYRAYDKITESAEDILFRFSSFGWRAKIVNGHSIDELSRAINSITNYPTVIITKTIKGKGVPQIENTLGSHYTTLNHEEHDKWQVSQTGELI